MCGVKLAVAFILAVCAVSAFADSSNGYEPAPSAGQPSDQVPAESYRLPGDDYYPPAQKPNPPHPDSWGFKCPCVGNFADPYSKNFISCVETIDGGFEAIPRDCPDDLCYNAPIDACDYPANVKTKQCQERRW